MPGRIGICGSDLDRTFLQEGRCGSLWDPGQGADCRGRLCGLERVPVVAGYENACHILIRCNSSETKSNESSGKLIIRF